MSEPQEVELRRTTEEDGRGTFGFSVSGGTGTKLPIVVWEVSPGLPADTSRQVHVGDILLTVNGRSLDDMSQLSVVELITSSPQVSKFVFISDEVIQNKVKRRISRQVGGRQKKENTLTVEPSVNSDNISDVTKDQFPTQGGSLKGFSREHKRSFVQHRRLPTKQRHRLSEGEEPLNSIEELIEVHSGLSSDCNSVGRGLSSGSSNMQSTSPVSSRLEHNLLLSSRRLEEESSSAEVSPRPCRVNNDLSPQVEKTSPNFHSRDKALSPGVELNSDQWDYSVTSSQSESSFDVISGSCDSLDNVNMEKPIVFNSSSPPIRRGESSVVKISSQNKKEVIKNLAAITSLPPPDDQTNFVTEKCSPCGPDPQFVLCPPSGSHDSTSTSHDPGNKSDPDGMLTVAQSPSIDSNISSQSIHIEFPDSQAQQPGEEVCRKMTDRLSLQPTTSIQSIGEVILPAVTPNSAHQIADIEHMTQIEIKQSKYGPHRYSNTSDEVDTSTPSTSHHHGDDNVDGYGLKIGGDRRLSDTNHRVRRTMSGGPLRSLDTREEAVVLARKLFMLDGFRRSQVASHLSDKSEFGHNVADEYLKFFDFENVSLDQALRQFVCSFILSGETHEQERIMQHFSHRYHQSNSKMFATADSCHSLICAMLLLNTDLHAEHSGSRMTQSQFITNIQGTGEHYPKDLLKTLYDNIKKEPLPLAIDEDVQDAKSTTQNGASRLGNNSSNEPPTNIPVYHVTFPGTFIEVDLAGDAPVFKEGEIYRKNVMEAPHKKVPSGKRKWKPYYAYLKGFLLYFIEPHEELYLDRTTNALPVTHCIAQRAFDYHKRSSVLRVTTSDWKVFLLQAPTVTEMQQWMTAINKASGTYSSIPLAAPIGSSSHFQRPMLPLAPTKLTQEQQIESHNARIRSLDKELEEHKAYRSANVGRKGKSNQAWIEKLEYLEFELTRYRYYVGCMTSTSIEELQTPIPSSLIPSPSVTTLATMNVDDITFRSGDPPSPTMSSHLELNRRKKNKKHRF